MNEQSAKLARWLLAGNGALKNVAQLLTDTFGTAAIVAATIDAASIIAYPVDPAATPTEDGRPWQRCDTGWTLQLHSKLLPPSTTADHHVVAGVTSRNELLIVNLAAVRYLGVEGADPIPMMRSWLMQLLSKTPSAQVAVTDPALVIADAPRLTYTDPAAEPPPDTTVLLTTDHVSGSDQSAPIVVSAQAAGAVNVTLLDGVVSSMYLANRYWPIWRRMELHEAQWTALRRTLESAPEPEHTEPPGADALNSTATETNSPPSTARISPPHEDPPSSTEDQTDPADENHSDHAIPQQLSPTTAEPDQVAEAQEPHQAPLPAVAEPAQPAAATAESAGPLPAVTALPLAPNAVPGYPPSHKTPLDVDSEDRLPGPPPPNAPTALAARSTTEELGLYVLGETYLLCVDPAGQPVKRAGALKPVMALMALATSNGLTSQQWDEILAVTPANRRQLRTTIKRLMGGADVVRERVANNGRLLSADVYCDWKHFDRLVGDSPEATSTENLTAAVQLIRGEPFTGVKVAIDGDYRWRAAEFLQEDLIVRCSTAALVLAERQLAAGDTAQAHRSAMRGLSAYSQREDLWLIALETAGSESERRQLLVDLRRAIPVLESPKLRQQIETSHSHSRIHG